MVEALAAGTPVLALDRGGASDIVRDGVNGVLIVRRRARAHPRRRSRRVGRGLGRAALVASAPSGSRESASSARMREHLRAVGPERPMRGWASVVIPSPARRAGADRARRRAARRERRGRSSPTTACRPQPPRPPDAAGARVLELGAQRGLRGRRQPRGRDRPRRTRSWCSTTTSSPSPAFSRRWSRGSAGRGDGRGVLLKAEQPGRASRPRAS